MPVFNRTHGLVLFDHDALPVSTAETQGYARDAGPYRYGVRILEIRMAAFDLGPHPLDGFLRPLLEFVAYLGLPIGSSTVACDERQ